MESVNGELFGLERRQRALRGIGHEERAPLSPGMAHDERPAVPVAAERVRAREPCKKIVAAARQDEPFAGRAFVPAVAHMNIFMGAEPAFHLDAE